MSDNVTSRTHRYVYVPAGHREPRRNIDGKKPPKTTSEVVDLVISQLDTVGATHHDLMRQDILGINRQRYYVLFGAPSKNRHGLFTVGGHVRAEGSPTHWIGGPNLLDLRSALKVALEPHWRWCTTGPGIQIICPLCGDTKKVVATEAEGIEWYYFTHLKGLAHQ